MQVLQPLPEHQEDVFEHLAARAAALHAAKRARVLIGIAGTPGSGKSTTAAAVCRLLNSDRFLGSERSIVVPMDGTPETPSDGPLLYSADGRMHCWD